MATSSELIAERVDREASISGVIEDRTLETSPLLLNRENIESSEVAAPASPGKRSNAVILLLLVGIFLANADQSLVLVTNSIISSEFAAFSSTSWLTTSYITATCAAQSVIGKLSDIFGRKGVLLSSYALFAIGSAICGFGQTMGQVIVGRVIAGVGGAGMTVLVSIIIVDLVPMTEVAPWRSYVNVLATTGRMVGAPLGGWITDFVGWRWTFLGVVPITILAMLFIGWKLPESKVPEECHNTIAEGWRAKLKRIDFPGAALLSSAIVLVMFAVDFAAEEGPLIPLLLIGTLSAALVLIGSFFLVELYGASEPIWPPHLLLHRNVAVTYIINLFHSGSQLGLIFTVPLYVQAIYGISSSAAGLYLIPTFVGNTFGSLLAGSYIKRTGYYKHVTSVGVAIAGCAYVAILLRWDGRISGWEALEVAPTGLGTGILGASTFIGLTAGLAQENMAVATAGHYLTTNIGAAIGVSIVSGLQKSLLRIFLERSVPAEDQDEIIPHVLANVLYIHTLHDPLRAIVLDGYVKSLQNTYFYPTLCSISVFFASLSIREHNLRQS